MVTETTGIDWETVCIWIEGNLFNSTDEEFKPFYELLKRPEQEAFSFLHRMELDGNTFAKELLGGLNFENDEFAHLSTQNAYLGSNGKIPFNQAVLIPSAPADKLIAYFKRKKNEELRKEILKALSLRQINGEIADFYQYVLLSKNYSLAMESRVLQAIELNKDSSYIPAILISAIEAKIAHKKCIQLLSPETLLEEAVRSLLFRDLGSTFRDVRDASRALIEKSIRELKDDEAKIVVDDLVKAFSNSEESSFYSRRNKQIIKILSVAIRKRKLINDDNLDPLQNESRGRRVFPFETGVILSLLVDNPCQDSLKGLSAVSPQKMKRFLSHSD